MGIVIKYGIITLMKAFLYCLFHGAIALPLGLEQHQHQYHMGSALGNWSFFFGMGLPHGKEQGLWEEWSYLVKMAMGNERQRGKSSRATSAG